MTAVIAFGLVAIAATLARAQLTAHQPGDRVPWRTLVVNATGAFVLGAVVAAWHDHPMALTVAGLGSITTFSTVVGETAALVDHGNNRDAIAYVGTTVVVGVAAAWLGLSIGDSL